MVAPLLFFSSFLSPAELHPAKKFGLLQLEFIERLGLQREEAFKKAFAQLEMGKYGGYSLGKYNEIPLPLRSVFGNLS